MTIQEEWRDIEGYSGLYQVSNLGRVKSLCQNNMKNGPIMKLCFDKYGYNVITLRNKGKKKTYKVHRLVAQHFIPNPQNLPQVNHIDEDKTDNRVENLEWCDASYNINYGTRNQIIAEKLSKPVICVETGKIYTSAMEVQRHLGFDNSSISKCCRGKLKQAYNYTWRYVS